MNILYLAHRIPYPPNKGDKIRSFHQLEHLSRHHNVWCACFVDTPEDFEYIRSLQNHCKGVIALPLRRTTALIRGARDILRFKTLTEAIYDDSRLYDALNELCLAVQFDVVVAFSSGMAPYGLHVPARRRVLDLCDLDSQKWLDYANASRGPQRLLYRQEGQRLSKKEMDWAREFDATILISEAEAKPLIQSESAVRVHHVGNGVALPQHRMPFTNSHPVVGFVGMMDYRPNVDAVRWFVEHCWPQIHNACPTAGFRIIGRSPVRKVRSLQSTPGVTVVGAVDDLSSELRRMDVSVAPMRIARGLQNKVLEAMAASIPVVLTSAAAEGIAGQHDRDFLKADNPEALSRTILNLLRDPAERMRIGDAGRRFVSRYHRWEEVLRQFELIVTGTIERTVSVATTIADKPRGEEYPHGVTHQHNA